MPYQQIWSKIICGFFVIFLTLTIAACSNPAESLKRASLVVFHGREKNEVFKEKFFNNDKVFILLKETFLHHNYDLNTFDITPTSSLNRDSIVLVARTPYDLPPRTKGKKFLWLLESPISINVAKNDKDMKLYNKIFTYDPNLVDNKKYFYLPVPYNYERVPEFFPTLADKTVLVVQIASNHQHAAPLQIYTERRKATEWFVKNAPNDFALYGPRWKKMTSQFTPAQQKNFANLYHGWAEDKLAVVQKAKFVLAYENAKFPGYVSEKIFDAMAGGAVPVYLGAPDIENYIPKACFINREDFSSYDELYSFLKNMPDNVYNSYVNCGKEFMRRPVHYNDSQTAIKILEKEIFSTFNN